MRYLFSAFFSSLLLISACAQALKKEKKNNNKTAVKEIITGAESTSLYLPLLKGKNIAIVANQTSTIGDTHLVDFLHKQSSIQVLKVFAPEHGFRGKADAGETIKDGIDTKTGLPIISLYGKNKKPSPSQLENIDIVVFDIQDVGARFYTYISTLHYVMEACAEANIPIIVLDRPNPNGHYVDGPLLDKKHKSFVGMHPVPVVYGMTIGEYGNMINGEKWLQNNINCDLTVIKLQNYNRNTPYSLPIKPSPNLPNDTAINLYPSLCFFEGTNVSAGRGTSKQFQIYGSPFLNKSEFSFTPKPNEGAKYPKHNGKICYGEDLSSTKKVAQIHLKWLINAYQQTSDKTTFFNSFFTKLAGTTKLQEQIKNGFSEQEIKASWKEDLNKFKKIRDKYLLYK
ncbi:exo-beta-N-acetylmuramidase NamZ family protein [Tenacibaculum geojense]|uniref:Exo-beta-N-acetylmuramidase NamZ domain-containing protein n=1 Tax=Tenacibaculum geojense TaxID=915352 RepID=A0ABW3JUX6_9FLAO